MTSDAFQARSADDVILAYGLNILNRPADWSIENGDLALTADGDVKIGSTAYNVMNRLVELWRFTEPNMQSMFKSVQQILHWQADIWAELNAAGRERHATMSADYWAGHEAFAKVLRYSHDKEAIAVLSAHNSAGCLLISLNNALSRFKSDIRPGRYWETSSPSFNGFSVGQIIIAAANGFRHEDEWARPQEMSRRQKERQKVSRDIIAGALVDREPAGEPTLPRSADIIQLLGNGDFDELAKNVLGFAHNVALLVEGEH